MLKVEINKLDTGEVEIKGEIPTDIFMSYWTKTVAKLNEQVKIDGFRSGHIPEKVLIEKVGEDKVLVEMADTALSSSYNQILIDNKINAIGHPQVSITKLAKDNPLGFTITTAVIPDIKLPDYKKLASETVAKAEKPTETTDKEVDDVVEELRKQRAMSLEENKDLKPEEKDNLVLPELNDSFVKTLGDFESVDDLKKKIKSNLDSEKEYKNKEKTRLQIMDAIADKVEVTIPQILVDNELNKMAQELEYEVSRMGLKFEDYLTHLKKTADELKASWKDDATKRVKLGLIINTIIEDAKLEATPEELEKEISHFMSHLGEQKPETVDLARLRAYAENTILHNKVFSLLESTK